MKKLWKIWKITANNALQEAFINRWTNVLFLIGKALRVGMSLVFLLLIRENVSRFGSYTTDQMIVFFLTYQIIDSVSQILYRGVYQFSQQVRTGEFDFLLMKPVSPLFRALTGKPDINDALFFIPTLGIFLFLINTLSLTISSASILLYLLFLVNGFLIATALHILVLVVGVLTTEVDGVIWMYRDLSRLGQFPISVYGELLRLSLFFIIPIGVMITIPAEILIGETPHLSVASSLSIGIIFFIISYIGWRWALRQYSSASS